MRKYYFLALTAALCAGLAVAAACGSKGTTNNYYLVDDDASPTDDDAAPDDDDNDDTSPADDDDDDDSTPADDDDDAAGCETAGYTQCTGKVTSDETACRANCTGRECQVADCAWTCGEQALTQFVACGKQFNCDTGLARAQCVHTCAQAAENCLAPLTTCTAARATRCDRDYNSCVAACPATGSE